MHRLPPGAVAARLRLPSSTTAWRPCDWIARSYAVAARGAPSNETSRSSGGGLVLSRELAADGDRRERFEREARAVAALNHPNTSPFIRSKRQEGFISSPLSLLKGGPSTRSFLPAGCRSIGSSRYAIPLADAANDLRALKEDLSSGAVAAASRVDVLPPPAGARRPRLPRCRIACHP
jgi:hypothetical protein